MLASSGIDKSWDIQPPLFHPQITGVVALQPACSNPGLGTTFVAARADGTSTNAAIATASANPFREASISQRTDRNSRFIRPPRPSRRRDGPPSASSREPLRRP
jgi:hypothetical protein